MPSKRLATLLGLTLLSLSLGVAAQAGPLFDNPPAAVAAAAPPSFAPIIKQYGQTVVHIKVQGEIEEAGPDVSQLPPQLRNSPFFQFFQGGPQRRVPTQGLGSGFIISSDGLVLTNAHVVKDAKTVNVTLSDRRSFKAKVLGFDTRTDIAVLKIPASKLTTVRLGDPSALQPGDWVLAIGAPYGFYNTATAGIVSAKSRSLPDDTMVPFIQTDVAVNPGNSGGPLFNARGEVVGINAQIYTQTGAFEGLSFAIPINVAENVVRQIVANGKVEHAKLGLVVQPVSQQLANSFGLNSPRGALVADVSDGGPAAKAGIKAGDIILSVNGQAIIDSSDLPVMIGQMKPGQSVRLTLWSNRHETSASATLASFGTSGTLADAGSVGANLGLQLRTLSAAEARQSDQPNALLVEGVSGAAQAAGVQPGDLLLAIDGKPVQGLAQVEKALKHPGKTVALLIQRGSNRIFIPVETD